MRPHPVAEKDVSHLTNGKSIQSVTNDLPDSLSNGRKSPCRTVRDRNDSISMPFVRSPTAPLGLFSSVLFKRQAEMKKGESE